MGTAVFLTMELVEGRSLAEALPATGLPIERVLTIGIAIADATSAAHQKGITHRDLKPGNIMLGEGEHAGRIKVLDFGLAKVVDVPRGAAAASMLPTEVPAHTADHSRGKSVTDINPAIPTELGRIIRRALAKDPERRYQTAKDLRNDLDDLKASLGSSESPLPPATSKATMTVHLGSVHVAGEERSTAVFRAAESPVQQRDEDLSSETRAFEHVTTAGKILEARQLRSVTTQRERRELRRRPAARQEIALDELGASAQTETRAAVPRPRAASPRSRRGRRSRRTSRARGERHPARLRFFRLLQGTGARASFDSSTAMVVNTDADQVIRRDLRVCTTRPAFARVRRRPPFRTR